VPYTYANLKSELQPLLWPQGEAENLILPHNKFFTEALIEIQRWADCYQYNNSQLYRACSRFYTCGLNVMEAPGALVAGSIANTIRRLSVIDQIDPATQLESAAAPDQWCSRIYYKQVPHCELLKYQQQVASCSSCGGNANFSGLFGFPGASCQKGNFPTPTDAEYLADPGLPLGHHYQPQVSTDSRWGRSRHGVWSLERGRIYLAPWLQSTETVIVEWDGIKADWDDLDLVVDNAQLKRAVRYYVLWNHLKDYERDDVAAAQAEKDWIMALRGLMRDCREETRVRGCEGSNARQADIISPETGVPTEATLQYPNNGGGAGAGSGGAGGGVPGCAAVEAPEFDPPSGAIVTFPTWVTITSATPGATIYFTTDGTEPTRASFLYSGPFRLAAGTSLNAVAFLGVCPSPENSADYISAQDYLNPEDDPTKTGSAPELTVLCTDTDRAGRWYIFTPDGSKDINWRLEFAFNAGSTVKRLEMFETDENGIWSSGRAWSTQYLINGNFATFPLVLDDGGQINNAYTTNLNEPGEDPHTWAMFGESVGRPSSGSHYKLIIYLEDGTKFYTTHSIECVDEDPEDPNCEELQSQDGEVSYSFNIGTKLGPDGTIVPAVVVTGTWVAFVLDQQWILGQVSAVSADGSAVTLDGFVAGVKYAPGDVVVLDGVAANGISAEEGCVVLPDFPHPVTTLPPVTTHPPLAQCEDCAEQLTLTWYDSDGTVLDSATITRDPQADAPCSWQGVFTGAYAPTTCGVDQWSEDESTCPGGATNNAWIAVEFSCQQWAVAPGGNCPVGFYGNAQENSPQPTPYIVIS
jgi:hypothetical protein